MEDGAAETKRDHNTSAEVWLGTTWRDDADAYARLVAECLRLFAHQVVYMHHGLPESSFRTATFGGLFLKECTEHDVADYINRCYNTLRRWATFQRLRTFTVAYVNETTQKNILAYEANFCESSVAPQQQLPNAGEELDELRLQMRKALVSLHCGPSDLLDNITEPVALRIKCALLDNTTVSDREHEHTWEPGSDLHNSAYMLMKPLVHSITCPIAEIRFRQFTCPPNVEREVDETSTGVQCFADLLDSLRDHHSTDRPSGSSVQTLLRSPGAAQGSVALRVREQKNLLRPTVPEKQGALLPTLSSTSNDTEQPDDRPKRSEHIALPGVSSETVVNEERERRSSSPDLFDEITKPK